MIEGTIAEWLVHEGSEIKKGEVAFTYENEKTTIDCECPADGIIHIVAKAGDIVKVGDPVAVLAESKEEYEAILKNQDADKQEKKDMLELQKESQSSQQGIEKVDWEVKTDMTTQNKGRIRSSGLARSIARKNKLDLHMVNGTGPMGRIVAKDVEAYLNVMKSSGTVDEKPVRTPITSIRRAIANNLRNSVDTMVQASSSTEFDVTELFELRKRLVDQKETIGWKITINDLLVMASVKVLEKHPLLNATFDGEAVTSYPYVNINVAVATESGLSIPVVRNADKMTLLELSKVLKDVAVRAREGKLKPGEQSGGSFTVSNVGMYPIDSGSPIANAPQVGLFGFGRPVSKLAKCNGEFCERTLMHVMFTFDHRVFDGTGKDYAGFTAVFRTSRTDADITEYAGTRRCNTFGY